MCRHQGLAVVLGVLLVASPLTQALFEDQAGSFDWYKAYIGHVLNGAFHSSKPRLYLGTQQGVAGAVNLRDGSIAWRHKLPQNEVPSSSVLLEDVFVTVSGNKLRAWEHKEGALAWEADVQHDSNAAITVIPGAKQKLAVYAGAEIKRFSASTGEELSTASVSDPVPAATSIKRLQSSPAGLTAYDFTPGQTSLNVRDLDGSIVSSYTVAFTQPLSSSAVSGVWGVAVLSQDSQSLCITGPGGQPHGVVECTRLSAVAPGLAAAAGSAAAQAGLQLVATHAGVALATGSASHPGVAVLQVSGSGSGSQQQAGLSLLKEYPTASAVSQPVDASTGQVIAVIESRPQGGVVVQYASTDTGKVVSSEGSVKGSTAGSDRLAAGATLPWVRSALLASFKRKDSSDGFRVLLVWSDERISLVQQGVTVWSRDEALAGVKQVLFTDLPSAAAVGSDAEPDFHTFVHLQLLSIKVQMKLASREETAELSEMRTRLNDKNLATRDTRGFRRALVVTTESGKVAALHNGDGRVLWSRPGSALTAPQHLVTWRTFHDLTHASLLATLFSDAASGHSRLAVLDAHTGAETVTSLPYAIDKLVPLGAIADGPHALQSLYLAVTLPAGGDAAAAPVVRLLPDSESARSHFATHYRSLFFWMDRSGDSNTLLQGYGFDAAASAALSSAPGASHTATSVWSFGLDEPRLTVTGRQLGEPVHTSVKVLGDRSMKYRYLSPNLLLLVTGYPVAQEVPLDERDVMAASISLVDAVTGALLHRQTAPGCRGPALALLSENLGVVQLWDAQSSRFAMTSLEVFDASEREFSVLDALFNPNATAPISSFDVPPLEVLTSTFYQRYPAKALASTTTRAGITSRMLLEMTSTDQVYALDMRFLDPRRPRRQKLTAEEQEERLIPYTDTLPVMPTAFVTYNKQVLGLRGVQSAASRLESTSLVFSWGVDLAYTRLVPAKNFDSLDDDFNFGLLMVALLALTVGSIFMHAYTKQAILKSKWQ